MFHSAWQAARSSAELNNSTIEPQAAGLNQIRPWVLQVAASRSKAAKLAQCIRFVSVLSVALQPRSSPRAG